jgi:hypothetical protein
MRDQLTWTLAAVLVFAMSGCASARAVTKAPPDAGTADGVPTDNAEDVENAFDAAERDLQALLIVTGGDGMVVKSDDDRDASQAAPADPAATQQSGRHRVSRCTRACRSLGSMQRSATRLCDLTGDEHTRCQSVTTRVDAARKMVRESCPSCSE